MAEGKHARWNRHVEDRRLAEIEARIARQLDLLEQLATRGEDAREAGDLLQTLLQAHEVLTEQRQVNMAGGGPGSASPAPDGRGDD